ncbi:hypothetical protein [Paenibacillus sp. FSL E2-0190]|uniref:restriction endonuclease n=1 Tax=Paenibacillus sp. FSL E2-0190 TaxID=2954504 RepID=UPI0030EC9A2D
MKNAWLIRPMPHGINRMKTFLDENQIAIGYPAGESFANLDNNDLKGILQKKGWVDGIGNVNTFVNFINIGDVIVVPDDNKRDVYLGEIVSDYIYIKQYDNDFEGYPHTRNVKWFFEKKPLFRYNLPNPIKGSLRYPGTIADLTKHMEAIDAILDNGTSELTQSNKSDSTEVLNEAIDVLRQLLNNENEEIRLRAAEVLLNHYR